MPRFPDIFSTDPEHLERKRDLEALGIHVDFLPTKEEGQEVHEQHPLDEDTLRAAGFEDDELANIRHLLAGQPRTSLADDQPAHYAQEQPTQQESSPSPPAAQTPKLKLRTTSPIKVSRAMARNYHPESIAKLSKPPIIHPVEDKAKSHIQKLFPHLETPEHVAHLAGVPHGTEAHIHFDETDPGSVTIAAHGSPHIRNFKRVLSVHPHTYDTELYNNEFTLHPDFQQSGLALDVLPAQAENLHHVGAARLVAVATVSKDAHYDKKTGKMAGKHFGPVVWPRLGYNAPLSAKLRENLPENLQGAVDFIDLTASKAGRQWLMENLHSVGDVEMVFDLQPGSKSINRLNEALRRAWKKPIKQLHPAEYSRRRSETQKRNQELLASMQTRKPEAEPTHYADSETHIGGFEVHPPGATPPVSAKPLWHAPQGGLHSPGIHAVEPHDRDIFHTFEPQEPRVGLSVASHQAEVPLGFHRAHQEHQINLPPHQQQTLWRYSSHLHVPLNDYLTYHPYDHRGKHHEDFHNLRQILESAPRTEKPVTAWGSAGIAPEQLQQYLEALKSAQDRGHLLKINGFNHFTLNPERAARAGSPVVFEVHGKHGSYLQPIHHLNNHEWFADHGSMYRIGDIHEAPFHVNHDATGRTRLPRQRNLTVVHLEQVPDIHRQFEEAERMRHQSRAKKAARWLLDMLGTSSAPREQRQELVKYQEENVPGDEESIRRITSGPKRIELVDPSELQGPT